MHRVAFLSTDNLEDFFVYDDLLIPYFEQKGWNAESVSWRKEGVNWAEYDAVIVRSTWDYQNDPDAFVDCLKRIKDSGTRLENPLGLMLWNLEKTYLQDLERRGVDVIPTHWLTHWDDKSVRAQFARFGTDNLIIKPVLSANADDTFRVDQSVLSTKHADFSRLFSQRGLMVQPFIDEVVGEGEYSLFYFNGALSHAILKQPAEGDFRVQEEHGGRLSLVQPDQDAVSAAEAALKAMPDTALYARVDLIRYKNTWRVMELELIEPSLYFQLDEPSSARFVDAFLTRYATPGN